MAHIRHLLQINAPQNSVYKAITEQDGLAHWWTTEVQATPEVGSVSEFRFGDRFFNKMKIVQLEKGQKVVWECVDGDEQWIGTQLTFDLRENENGGTELKFSHDNWKDYTDFFATCNYSWGWYLTSLKQYCEKGKGVPFPQAAEETTAII